MATIRMTKTFVFGLDLKFNEKVLDWKKTNTQKKSKKNILSGEEEI